MGNARAVAGKPQVDGVLWAQHDRELVRSTR